MTVDIYTEDFENPANILNESYSFTVSKAVINEITKKMCGPAGSVVIDDSSRIQLTIPENALVDTVEITLSEIPVLPVLTDSITGGVVLSYHFGPEGLTFEDTAVVAIAYSNADLEIAKVEDPMMLQVFCFNTTVCSWRRVKIDHVDEADSLIYIKIKEFSYLFICYSEVSSVDTKKDENNPKDFQLFQNYPNPFNPVTNISYSMPKTGQLEITMYDIRGRIVRILERGVKQHGTYEIVWNGRDDNGNPLASGIYLCFMKVDGFEQKRKLVLMK